ncbi:DNA replication ATP-dependent helicase/nuclease DNA2 isoform X2 [Drosophila ananassae]|uniref:DNA replication ATP-dependent helicase/nuclease DNA2 isoform X2 n=1 Tax=Drosophila ananassae TaxID=7217 RepID=UPI001CFF893A|nr:DNA replication ATP-dependent helicase/nuclease DNA2 isoform X2 [Drosophila ananassae]
MAALSGGADLLISATTLTGSLFCRRKSVIQERFRGLDAGSSVMVIGTLVHELLQNVLVGKLSTKDDLQLALQKMLSSSSLVHLLYANNLSQAEVELQLRTFLDPISRFVSHYINGEAPDRFPSEAFQGRIQEIRDIEENLWVPQLGLKGKVDVSVRVKSPNQTEKTIPLELKTGRASFSMEHKGQLLLYELMHSVLGKDTQSGLLLYIREGLLREVPSSRNEQRDLVLLRNDLVYWLTREVSTGLENTDPLPQLQLPEPIYHHSACGNCAYNTICSSFAQSDNKLELNESHPIKKLMPQLLSHLLQRDHDYVHHWCSVLALEEQHNRQSNQFAPFWTEDARIRQKQGRAMGHLKLRSGQLVDMKGGRFKQSLELNEEADLSLDLRLSGFDLDEYVVVSSSSRLAVASGFIDLLEKRHLVLRLDRDLSKTYEGETFIVDKNESQNFSTFNYTNLGLLLSDEPRFQKLREIVVAKIPPTQSKILPALILTKGAKMLLALNKIQRAAALRALTTSSHLLIKGLPGTGKTQTLVSLVRVLHLLGKSVLITAHTHSAVDNLLLRLLPFNLPLMRLGSNSRIHPQLEEISEARLTQDCTSVEELAKVLEQPSIVGVTCLGTSHALFQRRNFDYCIVDEATQVLQPTVLRPLSFCSKFVLVGDPKQLPPVIRSSEARQRGAEETLFHRLDSQEATAVLSLQYRMNKTITRLANELTYAGQLQCASETVSGARLQLQPSIKAPKWVQKVLQTHLDQAVFFINTGDCLERCEKLINACMMTTSSFIDQKYEDQGEKPKNKCKKRVSKYANVCEAGVVMHLLRYLLKSGFDASQIGVIAPYRAQVELVKKLVSKLDPILECNTVDQYQGRDKDLIIYSCSKTGSRVLDMERSRESEILEDQRRLTVAITRAKCKLILMGDIKCLEQYGPFRELFKHIPERCRLKLQDGHYDFAWHQISEELDFI